MPRCPAWLRFLRPLRAASPERLSDLDVLTPLSASHFPERQTARRKNLLQAWQDHGHEPPTIESVSTRQPLAPTASSVPMRQRRITACPLRLGPRFTTVLIYPLELPLHASRSASGLLAVLSIVPVYSPLTKLPPTAASVTSVNAPPLILGEDTSNTPPSQNVPSLNSVSKLFRNESTGACTSTSPVASSGFCMFAGRAVTSPSTSITVSLASPAATRRTSSGAPGPTATCTRPARSRRSMNRMPPRSRRRCPPPPNRTRCPTCCARSSPHRSVRREVPLMLAMGPPPRTARDRILRGCGHSTASPARARAAPAGRCGSAPSHAPRPPTRGPRAGKTAAPAVRRSFHRG